MYVGRMSGSSSVETWERFVRFQRATTMEMDRHLRRACGHSLDDHDVMRQIAAHDGPMRMGELADRLLVANSSCHRIVSRLVEGGLVERHVGDNDARTVLVELTTAGTRLWRRMAAVHTRDIETLFRRRVSADELRRVDTMLRRLLETPVADPVD